MEITKINPAEAMRSESPKKSEPVFLEKELENKKDIMGKRVSQMSVKSPFSGKVYSVAEKNNKMVTQGALLAVIGSKDSFTVKTELLSDDMADIKVGLPIEISSEFLKGKKAAGIIKKIDPRAKEKVSSLGVLQHRVEVAVALKEPMGLQPGYEVNVSIPTDKRDNVIVLPREAIRFSKDGDCEIGIVNNDAITIRKIKYGLRNGKEVEVVEGLTEGEHVILDGSAIVEEGDSFKRTLKTDIKKIAHLVQNLLF